MTYLIIIKPFFKQFNVVALELVSGLCEHWQ